MAKIRSYLRWVAADKLPKTAAAVGRKVLVPDYGEFSLHFDPLQGLFAAGDDGYVYRVPLDGLVNGLITKVSRRPTEPSYEKLPRNATTPQIIEFIEANCKLRAGPLPDPCWIWQRTTNSGGSPILVLPDVLGVGRRKQRAVRRWMFTKLNGRPPASYVKMACGIGSCLNPAHFIDSGAQLSVRERQVLDYYRRRRAYPPTFREVAKAVDGLTTPTSASHVVNKLVRLGLLERAQGGAWRGIRVAA